MTDIYEIMAKYYDEMYSWKDYEAESQRIIELVDEYKSSTGKTLLDVGCGTGAHIEHLRHQYNVTGLDLSEEMLKVARSRFEDIEFIQQDMTKMNLDLKFDILTCLFGAIGHLTTRELLSKAINTFSNHLHPGGVVIIEPFVTKEKMRPSSIGLLTLDKPDIKIARVNASRLEGDILYLDFHFLIATRGSIEHIVDPSPMGIFSRAVFIEAMENSGFRVEYVEPGLMERTDLFVGVKI